MRSAAAVLAIGAVMAVTACTDTTGPTTPAPNQNASVSFGDGTEVRANTNGTATIFKNGKPIITVRHSGVLLAPTRVAGMMVADDPCMFDAAYAALSGNCNTPPTLNGGAGSGSGSYYGGCPTCGDALAKYLASGWAAGMTTSQLMEMAAAAVSPYAFAALGGAWVYVGYLLYRYYQCYSAYQACIQRSGGGGTSWAIESGRSWP